MEYFVVPQRTIDFLNLTRQERILFLMGYDVANGMEEVLKVPEDKAVGYVVKSRIEQNDPLIEALCLEPAFIFGMRDAIQIKRERVGAFDV